MKFKIVLENKIIKYICWIVANLMTLSSFLLAIFSIIYMFKSFTNYIVWFPKVLAVCCILDFTDGKLARISGLSEILAVDIDTIVDAVTFALLPSIFLGFYIKNFHVVAGIMSGLIYFIAAIYRLYRFTKRDPLFTLYFEGVPSPFAAMVIGSLIILEETPEWAILVTTLAVAIFMITKTPFPSFKGDWKAFDLFWVISTTIIILSIAVLPFDLMKYPGYVLSVWMLIYMAFGPQYVLFLERKKNQME